jgi:succinate dehydrogenase/fumarate reductase flavoprotein subunit
MSSIGNLQEYRSVAMSTIDADVLVLGGGPSGAWAALTAAAKGARVVLADKGFLGTSGATAAANTTIIHIPPDPALREAAFSRRWANAFGIADRGWIERVIDATYFNLNRLADWGYPFPTMEDGTSYRGTMRGPDYMRFLRRRLRKAGVTILDQSPALELLIAEGSVAGAAGINRVSGERWAVRAGAVVMATGGCAFLSKALGTNGLTGDGTLFAAEAGAVFSGMEWSGHYSVSAAFASVTKGIVYFWGTFTDEAGNVLAGRDRQSTVAQRLIDGPVYAVLDKASPRIQEGMRKGQPNIFLPFDRTGIDPFTQRFPVTLRYEGTVRGVGGLAIDEDCATSVPGLYAAGDAASRENLVGATSGGGGPNATWAVASGVWAGQTAAAFAARLGPHHASRRARGIGGNGLRPSEQARDLDTGEIVAGVQREVLPLDKNFFRSERGLGQSLGTLDTLWRETAAGLVGSGPSIVRARETAAMIATSRLMYASALQRRESRGMHRHRDYPDRDPAQARRLLSGGLDRVWVRPEAETPASESILKEAIAS